MGNEIVGAEQVVWCWGRFLTSIIAFIGGSRRESAATGLAAVPNVFGEWRDVVLRFGQVPDDI